MPVAHSPFVVVVAGREIRVTGAAQSAYRDRVRAGLTISAARTDLERLASLHGEIRRQPPAWEQPASEQSPPAAWLLLGDDIALRLTAANGLAAVACVTRGSLTPDARAARTRLHRRRRRRARAHQCGGRPRRPIAPFDKTTALGEAA